jgi:hypothetical protein
MRAFPKAFREEACIFLNKTLLNIFFILMIHYSYIPTRPGYWRSIIEHFFFILMNMMTNRNTHEEARHFLGRTTRGRGVMVAHWISVLNERRPPKAAGSSPVVLLSIYSC